MQQPFADANSNSRIVMILTFSSVPCLFAGKNGVVPPDQVTFDYVKARTNDPFEPVYSDPNASFVVDYR